jgi:hypothetical protein
MDTPQSRLKSLAQAARARARLTWSPIFRRQLERFAEQFDRDAELIEKSIAAIDESRRMLVRSDFSAPIFPTAPLIGAPPTTHRSNARATIGGFEPASEC